MSEQGFTQSKTDQALFVKVEGKEEVYVNVHVDDFLSTGTPKLLADYRRRLYAKFKMTGGLVERHYGLNIRRGKLGEVFVDCQDYILNKCKELNIAPGKFNTPMAADLVLPKIEAPPHRQFSGAHAPPAAVQAALAGWGCLPGGCVALLPDFREWALKQPLLFSEKGELCSI